MQQHGSKYFAPRPPTHTHTSTLGMGSIGKNSTFSEHSQVAYKIKGNHECSNVVANILNADPPPPSTLGMGSMDQKNHIYSEHGHVAYQIKGNLEMQQHGSKYFTCRPLPTPMTLGDGVKRSKFNFFRTWPCCISN